MTLTEFLKARLDEDEQAAGNAPDPAQSSGSILWSNDFGEIIMSTTRMLAEVDAKRRIVAECEYEINDATKRNTGDGLGLAETMLALLALPHADHPDYQPDWRP